MGPSYNDSFSSFSSGGGGSVRSIVSSGDGGVVLPEGKKHSGRILLVVLSVVVVLALVIGLIALMFMGSSSESGNSDFDALKKYIEVGEKQESGGSDDNSNNELIYAVSVSFMGRNAVKEYYGLLDEKEKSFYDGINDDSDYISEYKEGLRILRGTIDYYEIQDEIIERYTKDGVNSARKYINDSMNCERMDSDLKIICEMDKNYYRTFLRNHALFSESGCYKGGNYVMECAISYYGEKDFYEKMEEIDSSMGDYSLTNMKSSMMKMLSENIIELNKKMAEVLKR